MFLQIPLSKQADPIIHSSLKEANNLAARSISAPDYFSKYFLFFTIIMKMMISYTNIRLSKACQKQE